MKTTQLSENQAFSSEFVERIIDSNCCFTLKQVKAGKIIDEKGYTIIVKGFEISITNPKDKVCKTIPAPRNFTTLDKFVNKYLGYNTNYKR